MEKWFHEILKIQNKIPLHSQTQNRLSQTSRESQSAFYRFSKHIAIVYGKINSLWIMIHVQLRYQLRSKFWGICKSHFYWSFSCLCFDEHGEIILVVKLGRCIRVLPVPTPSGTSTTADSTGSAATTPSSWRVIEGYFYFIYQSLVFHVIILWNKTTPLTSQNNMFLKFHTPFKYMWHCNK